MFEHHLTRGVAIGLFYFQDHDSGTGVTRDSATRLSNFSNKEAFQSKLLSDQMEQVDQLDPSGILVQW